MTNTKTMELPDAPEMERRLTSVWGDPMTGGDLFPYYLVHAGEIQDGKGVVDMLVKANEAYAANKPSFVLAAVTALICGFSAVLIGDDHEILVDAQERHAELGHS
jgi:hypothetical protein